MLITLRRFRFLLVSSAVLLLAAAVVRLPVFLEGPGNVESLGELVEVGTPEASPLQGDFLLTTVSLTPGTVFGVAEGLITGDELLPERQVVTPGLAPSAFFDHQRLVFESSGETAAAVGLRAAGYPSLLGEGALVTTVAPGSPASRGLAPGDVVVAVNGRPVRTGYDLSQAVRHLGERPLQVRYLRDGRTSEVELVPQVMPPHPVIGVGIQTVNPRTELPVPVMINGGEIGGPSAGLMIALTVYDKSAPGVDLARGRRIAGTGAISDQGRVLPIGGIEQKVVAAASQDVDVFLAPLVQSAAAQGAVPADSDLRVLAVADFEQAVAALQANVA